MQKDDQKKPESGARPLPLAPGRTPRVKKPTRLETRKSQAQERESGALPPHRDELSKGGALRRQDRHSSAASFITGFNTFTQSQQAKRLSKLRGVNMTFPLFILLSFVILVFALMALDNSSVQVDRQTISLVGLPEDLEGYTILQVSDLHGRDFGAHQAALLRTINAESYNLLVFTGDMVGASGNAQPFYDLLDGLAAKRPRYFIPGDSDPDILSDEPRDAGGTLEQVVLSDWVLGAKSRGRSFCPPPRRWTWARPGYG
jgi:hypothetical protein